MIDALTLVPSPLTGRGKKTGQLGICETGSGRVACTGLIPTLRLALGGLSACRI